MMKTPVQTPNRKHRGRPPRIKPEPGQLVCPACQTVWNGKNAPCRACNKDVQWETLYNEDYQQRTKLAEFRKHKKKLRRARERKKQKEIDARNRVLEARAERKRLFWEAQCKKKKLEKFNKINENEDNDENINVTDQEEAGDTKDEDNQDGTQINNGLMDFSALAESQRISAKAKKKGMTVEEYQNLSESESDSDDEAAKDPNSFVETIPYGYSFPLLLSSLERDRGFDTVFGAYPKNYNKSEGLLRTVETLTKFDVDKYGNRRHTHIRKKKEKLKKQSLDRKMYLYNLHNNKKRTKAKIAKSTDNLKTDSFFGPTIVKKEKSWISIQDNLKSYANNRSQYMLNKLRDDNRDAAVEAKKFLSIDYSQKVDRQALTSYYVGKHAKKIDDWYKIRDEAGQVGLTDELKFLKQAISLDETFLKSKFEKD